MKETVFTIPSPVFEDHYNRLRSQEKRLYSDAELLELPRIVPDHPHAPEWKCREQSAIRLTRYLGKKQRKLNILEVGCGNGWLTRQLSSVKNAEVLGIDIHQPELDQAQRVFGHTPHLRFEFHDFNNISCQEKFDVIVFAAAMQYFPSLTATIIRSLPLLHESGELHILDSAFYRDEELPAARERSRDYFQSIGNPEMSEHYFHHRWDELEFFDPEYLYRPYSSPSLFNRVTNPFPWIMIRKAKVK